MLSTPGKQIEGQLADHDHRVSDSERAVSIAVSA